MMDKFQEFSAIISRGEDVLAEIDKRISDLVTAEVNFAKTKIHIGMLLNEVRVNHYWKEGHESFDAYLKTIETRFDRKRTALYSYAGLVRDLLPELGEDKLAEMGIEKAKLLGQVKKSTGSLPSAEIIEMAADDSVSREAFREVLLGAKKLPDIPGGKYHSIEYFATADQQAAISSALLSAKRTENLTGADEVQMGCALECLAAEYLGANSGVL